MNEAETRAELIDPKLAAAGWGTVEDSRIRREFKITDGTIKSGGRRGRALISDYVLVYKGIKLAAMEAKSDDQEVSEGVGQAKNYALHLDLKYSYACNGRDIYQICMDDGTEGIIDRFPTPQELWDLTFADNNNLQDTFNEFPLFNNGGRWESRYYQENAINRVLNEIAKNQDRILLTMATGTGKTAIAAEICWKLFSARWNRQLDGSRRPRILFLADRNILADQAFNAFSAFDEDALVRIRPNEITKKGHVPTNGNVFFTIFQTFMSGPDESPYFGDYPPDYFDLVIIDECHRGGANDESTWRKILEYFEPAVQLGLTATPKRDKNVDTYNYFGDPVYQYSLKQGINDGFLTPFRIKRIKSTIDEYTFDPTDEIIEGEIDPGKIYGEQEFNKDIEIKEREKFRAKQFLEQANQKDKSLVFCRDQSHAALVRDLINQNCKLRDPLYCVRVTANDGALGEQYLRTFQDNEKTIPTILTTSKKLSTGVDARNVRNIVIFRPVDDIIEFKQIIGRGTRLFDGKDYFTIYDFVGLPDHFNDPEWDGDPIEPEVCNTCGEYPCVCIKERKPCANCGERPCICPKEPCSDCGERPCVCIKKVKIKLADGKDRNINSTTQTSFWSPDGKPITAEQFIELLFGKLPEFYTSETELRELWANPTTRKALLEKLDAAGFGSDVLEKLRDIVASPASDLFDVLEYISFAVPPKTRTERVMASSSAIYMGLTPEQHEFIHFVLDRYIDSGFEVLDREALPELLKLKYYAIEDALKVLGNRKDLAELFVNFQKFLYDEQAA